MTDLDILADPADSAPSEYPHGHALSDKSEALQRDTYFFSSGHPTRLVLGFNQKLTPLSSAKLHRWTDLMSGWKQGFYICPVSVKPCGVMVYSISPSGPVIDVDSEELLPPGNYGWYCDRILSTSGLIMLAGVEASARNTSFEYHVTVDRHEGFLGPYEIPADIARVVVVRDQRACRVTGSTNDTVSTWIVPPTWAWTTIREDPVTYDPTERFVLPANVFTLHKDLKVHFYNHSPWTSMTTTGLSSFATWGQTTRGSSPRIFPTHATTPPMLMPSSSASTCATRSTSCSLAGTSRSGTRRIEF